MFVNKIKAQNKKKVLLKIYLLPPVSMLWKFNAAVPNCSEKSELYQKQIYSIGISSMFSFGIYDKFPSLPLPSTA